MTGDTREIPTDTALDLVASERRRVVLHSLIGSDEESVSMDELVARVLEHDSVRSGGGRERTRRIRLQLLHTHLPKLAEAGVIDFDERSGTIRYRPDEGLEDLLEYVADTME